MAHPALTIPLDLIDAAIASLVALRLDPTRDGKPFLDVLTAINAIEGCGSLQDTISQLEHDLSDEATCLVCEQPSCGCDARYEDHVSWGLGSASERGVWF